MPRGLKYKFVPTKSGAYLIQSQSTDEVDGWIFGEDYQLLLEASIVSRPYGGNEIDTTNVTMLVYLEAGKTYYIDIAYYDVYAAGTFTFTVTYLSATYNQFHLASPAYFTYIESTTGSMNETIAGGIDVIYSDPAKGGDGYYHELRADGSVGSIIYADFSLSTGFISRSIQQIITMGGFNFGVSEYDQAVLTKLTELGGDTAACMEYYRTLWGDQFDYWNGEYKLEEIFAGKYHGGVPLTDKINEMLVKLASFDGDVDACRAYYEQLWVTKAPTSTDRYALELALSGTYTPGSIDLTSAVSAYLSKMLPTSTEAPELEGCVAVDFALAELLQALVDKYSFSGVDHAWTKLCYYYKTLGPVSAGE